MENIRKPKGSVISKIQAIQICMDWHGGSNSKLYQFLSSGVYMNENYKRYIYEISECVPPNKQQENKLKSLKKWFDYKHWESNKK